MESFQMYIYLMIFHRLSLHGRQVPVHPRGEYNYGQLAEHKSASIQKESNSLNFVAVVAFQKILGWPFIVPQDTKFVSVPASKTILGGNIGFIFTI